MKGGSTFLFDRYGVNILLGERKWFESGFGDLEGGRFDLLPTLGFVFAGFAERKRLATKQVWWVSSVLCHVITVSQSVSQSVVSDVLIDFRPAAAGDTRGGAEGARGFGTGGLTHLFRFPFRSGCFRPDVANAG